jgi:hypothetical protein
MDVEDKQLLDETYAAYARYLDRNHSPGFGIFPSADPASNYFNQVWARDTAHAAAHYFARAKPGAVIDSLRTFLKHQRTDGALPSRVEREYQTLKLTPGLRRLAGPFFRLIEGSWRGRLERPVHEGQDSAGGEDTVPAVLIAAGELFDASRDGVMDGDEARVFIKENFGKLEKAADFFRTTKTDPADGLAVMTRDNPDWADTIQRKGKLGLINIWWWRGLRHMQDMAEGVGDARAAGSYRRESEKVKQGIMEKLYDVRGGFFRAETNDDRLDAAASIFGALYFLSPDEMLQVEQTLKRRVARASGLQNFDPPYPQKDIFWAHRLMGQWLYHNQFVWPWVTLQNIFLKIKIAREHDDAAIRGQYRGEAVDDLVAMAKRFKVAGGAYEVFEPDEPRRGATKFYHPPQNFMGSMAAYQGVYARLKALGWI